MNKHRKINSKHDFRIDFLLATVFIIAGIIIYRLFVLQVLNHKFYVALAQNQHEIIAELEPERGQIFASDKYSSSLYPLASNQKLYLSYAIPRDIKDKKYFSEKLSPILNIDQAEILSHIEKENDLYEPLKNKLTDSQVSEIKALGLKGIGFTEESWRIYPEGNLASHILGFVGYSGNEKKGRYGIENFYNQELNGQPGRLEAEKDVAGRWISIGKKELKPAVNGDDLILTIDRAIQYKTESVLKASVEKWGAESGTIIILAPQTGEVIAMANYPNYDNNQFSSVSNVNIFNNAAIFEHYEPGSAFKPICMAIGIDENVVAPDTTYTDTGSANIGGYTIHNYDNKSYGLQTMTNVLEKSINTGMVFVNNLLGTEKLYNGLLKFGFNELTGIDLSGETNVELKSPRTWRKSNLSTIGYGQGIAMTPIELATATSAMANNGNIMLPHLVKEIIHHHADGTETREIIEPKLVRQAIKPATAATITAMLVSSAENGYAKTARIPGYHFAGKTGTAQVPSPAGGYDPENVITSFIGYGPIEDPRFLMLVKFNKPKSNSNFRADGVNTAAPVFKEIAQFLINYYQIPPTD